MVVVWNFTTDILLQFEWIHIEISSNLNDEKKNVSVKWALDPVTQSSLFADSYLSGSNGDDVIFVWSDTTPV